MTREDEVTKAKRDGLVVVVLTLPKVLLAATGVAAVGLYGAALLTFLWWQMTYVAWITQSILPLAGGLTFVYFVGLAVTTEKVRR